MDGLLEHDEWVTKQSPEFMEMLEEIKNGKWTLKENLAAVFRWCEDARERMVHLDDWGGEIGYALVFQEQAEQLLKTIIETME